MILIAVCRNRWSGACLVLLLALLSTFPALADDQRALLTLRVNTQFRGEVPVVVREADILVRVQDLEAARLRLPDGARTLVANELYVSLTSLAPALTYTFDENTLQIHITADPAHFTSSTHSLAVQKPAAFRIATETSAFLNYTISSTDLETPTGAIEVGSSLGGRLLFLGTAHRTTQERYLRGHTALSYEDHERLARLTVGDANTQTSALGGGGTVAGLTYRREFRQDPYFQYRPDYSLTGVATTPSTAKLYFNGVPIREQRVPSGPFELRNVLIPGGTRTVDLVVRDAFGRETRTTLDVYTLSSLLAPGVHDYSYTVGTPRRSTDRTRPWGSYGSPAFLGHHRVGLTRMLTAGGRLEAAADRVSVGPALATSGPWGQLAAEVAMSYGGAFASYAVDLNYFYSTPLIGAGLSLQRLGTHYTHSTLAATEDRATLTVAPSFNIQPLPQWNIDATLAYTTTRDTGPKTRYSVMTSYALTKNLSVLLTGSYTTARADADEFQAGLILNYAFGRGYAARSTTRYASDTKTTEQKLIAEKTVPTGEGLGFRLSGSQDSDAADTGQGFLQYHSAYGDFESEISSGGDDDTRHRLSYSGGVVVMNRRAFIGRPVDQAFAIVDTQDLPNIQVSVNNVPLGTTDRTGTLLVPNLLPYYANTVQLNAEDIPIDRSIETSSRLAVPPLRGGAYLTFPTTKVRGAQGQIRPQVPQLAFEFGPGFLTVTAGAERFESPVGRQGEFYLENLPPGIHTAEVALPHLTCRAQIQITDSPAPLLLLGDIPCLPDR